MRLTACASIGLLFGAACVTQDDGPGDGGPSADAAAGSTASGPANAWLGADREATFRAHVERVRAVQSLSTAGLARLGTTWESELDPVRTLYREAKTAEDVHLALVALKNSFHDAHADVRSDGLPRARSEVALSFTVRVEYEGGRARYVVRDGGALPAGSAIVAVDDVPIERLEQQHRTWYAGGSSPEGLREDVARWLSVRASDLEPTPLAGSKSSVVVRGPGGDETRHELTWKPRDGGAERCPPYADPCAPDADGDYAAEPTFVGLGYCVYASPASDARIVRYRTLYYPEARDPAEAACLAKKLPRLSYPLTTREAASTGPRGVLMRDQGELLDHLARSGVKRVLFDVRENTGGDFDPAFFGAFTQGAYAQPLKSFVFQRWFRDDPSRIRDANVFVGLLDGSPVDGAAGKIEAFLRSAPSSAASPPIPFYCQTPACAESEANLVSQSNVVFRAAVLTGPRCLSACDDFVSMFRKNGIAKTIGLPTAAGDAPYSYDVDLPLANGQAARMHLTVGVSFHPGTKTPLEGNPVEIDVPHPPTAANRGRYVAEAFARAPF